jgi:hypothetical protein
MVSQLCSIFRQVFIAQLHRRSRLLSEGFQSMVLDVIQAHEATDDLATSLGQQLKTGPDEFNSAYIPRAVEAAVTLCHCVPDVGLLNTVDDGKSSLHCAKKDSGYKAQVEATQLPGAVESLAVGGDLLLTKPMDYHCEKSPDNDNHEAGWQSPSCQFEDAMRSESALSDRQMFQSQNNVIPSMPNKSPRSSCSSTGNASTLKQLDQRGQGRTRLVGTSMMGTECLTDAGGGSIPLTCSFDDGDGIVEVIRLLIKGHLYPFTLVLKILILNCSLYGGGLDC